MQACTLCSGLVQGSDGFFYGTTPYGAAFAFATVFRIDASGSLSLLHRFNGDVWRERWWATSGRARRGQRWALLRDNFRRWSMEHGSVFRVDTTGVAETLYSFIGSSGGSRSGLVQGSDGSFYGTTSDFEYPEGNGTIFKIDSPGSLTTLHTFTTDDGLEAIAGDGGHSVAGLVEGDDGSFYGTTRDFGSGGTGAGTVFKVDASGNVTTLHFFGSERWRPSQRRSHSGHRRELLRDDIGGRSERLWNGLPNHAAPVRSRRFTASPAMTARTPCPSSSRAATGTSTGLHGRAARGGHGTVFRIRQLRLAHDASQLYQRRRRGSRGRARSGQRRETLRNNARLEVHTALASSFGSTVPLSCFPTLQISGPDAVCAGQSVTLDAGAGFSSYLWSTGATTPDDHSDAVRNDDLLGLRHRSIRVHWFCDEDRHGQPRSGPAYNQPPTPDGSVTLTSSTSNSYLWSTGATTQSINVSGLGAVLGHRDERMPGAPRLRRSRTSRVRRRVPPFPSSTAA